MARKVRHYTLETRTQRLKLAVRRKPFNGPSLARGILLQYRRNKGNGAWVLKASDGRGSYWTKAIAEADDYDDSDGKKVLTYFEAQDIAKRLARGSSAAADTTAPVTVERALTDYKADLIARNSDPYNADRARPHLTAGLVSKPVQLLTSKELKGWRDGLLDTIKPASINRLLNALCAAFELARQHDPRIQNRDAWEVGLAGLPNAQTARNVVLSDTKVHAVVAAGYGKDHQLGLLIDVLAGTGARPSQATRLRVEDLRDHPTKPKLMMPKSAKGGDRNRAQKKIERFSVPITVALAKRLKAAAKGRAGDAPLLLRSNGEAWSENKANLQYRRDVREVVAEIGEDPDEVTLYALRHSSIVRMLLKNIPIRLVASLHNTSVGQIERNYSRYITEHSIDDITRAGLLSEPATVGNVIPLAR